MTATFRSVTALLALLILSKFLFAQAQAPEKPYAPIQLDPQNPHYYLFRDRVTVLVSSGEHYGAVLNADFDYRRYLSALETTGLNYTRLFPGSYVEVPAKSFGILRNDLAPASGRFLAPWARSDSPGYAAGGGKFDLDRWDPVYFERLHDFLAEAERRNIVVEISLFSSQYGEMQWNVNPFHPANNINHTDAVDWKKLNTLENGDLLQYQERYTRKIVREVNAFPNVIFEIANEPWSDRPVLTDVVNPYLFPPGRDTYPNSVDLPDDLTMAWQERVAEWITSEEVSLANKHLIAQNYCNFRLSVRRPIPGVSILNFHYAYPEAVALNYGLGKALAYDETGFLGREDANYLRQAWSFLLSGGSAFNNLDYSFSVGHEDGTDAEPNGPGGGGPEFRRQLRVLLQFLQSLPLVDMSPDARTVKHSSGVYPRVLSSSAGIYAIYLDGNGPTELCLDLPAGRYALAWLDLRTGATIAAGELRHPGGEKTLLSPEFAKGIALKIIRSRNQ
jgi:hypothetical protein